MLTYVVDAHDRIREVGDGWDEFAQENGAPELVAEKVVGRLLSDFVAGAEMKELTRRLLQRLRDANTLALDFRCDAPAERRFLHMELQSLPDDGVRFTTTLLRSEARPAVLLIERGTPRSRDVLVVCGWCNRVRLPDRSWTEVEQAVAQLSLFGEDALPQLSHGICETCRPLLMGAA